MKVKTLREKMDDQMKEEGNLTAQRIEADQLGRDREESGYWQTVRCRMGLFSPAAAEIERHNRPIDGKECE